MAAGMNLASYFVSQDVKAQVVCDDQIPRMDLLFGEDHAAVMQEMLQDTEKSKPACKRKPRRA